MYHSLYWLGRNRRAGVALLTALLLIPILGLIGLAIDYSTWQQAYAALYTAANGAALNAVKTAVASRTAGNKSYQTDGRNAGAKWFAAQIGAKSYFGTLSSLTPTVTITPTGVTQLTAKVTLSTDIKSIFGIMFSVAQYPLSLEVDATITTAPYLEVIFMLDNSSSMQIGATETDIGTLSMNSPCDPSNAYYETSPAIEFFGTLAPSSLQPYGYYQCSYDGATYDGGSTQTPGTTCEVAAPATLNYPAATTAYPPTLTSPTGLFEPLANPYQFGPNSSQTCQGILPAQADGTYPLTGAPCAFACHWTNTKNKDGTTADLYGMARRLGVTLRFDLLKVAVNAALKTLQTENTALHSLTTGIYTFNSTVTQVYPTNCTPQAQGCEAANGFTTAQSLVGNAPTLPSVTETGIQPLIGQLTGNNNDTAFDSAMETLANTYVTKAGNGTASAAPRKALFIVTDGMDDDPTTGFRGAMSPTTCDLFKNMGYTVYVVYTPYYPVMHVWYLTNAIPIVEGDGPSSLSYNLQACASTPSDYISVNDQTSLTDALQSLLQAAINQAAIFSK